MMLFSIALTILTSTAISLACYLLIYISDLRARIIDKDDIIASTERMMDRLQDSLHTQRNRNNALEAELDRYLEDELKKRTCLTALPNLHVDVHNSETLMATYVTIQAEVPEIRYAITDETIQTNPFHNPKVRERFRTSLSESFARQYADFILPQLFPFMEGPALDA